MTTISYMNCYDEHILECVGHVGSAPYGSDLLCSAVSALYITVQAYLEKAEEKGLIRDLKFNACPGYAVVSFCTEEGSEAEKSFEAILEGFSALANSFPDYIEFDN